MKADSVFLNHCNQTAQGYGYALFSKVIDRMRVVDRIAAA